jgi:hypothetical protein
MADFYSVKDDAAKLVIQLGTEIDLFFVLGSLLLLLDAYLYRGSNRQYSLLTFDWSPQHGFNIGAIVGFFVAFSFVMTIVTPSLLVAVEFLMVMPWWFTFALLVMVLPLAFKVGMPFLRAILVVLATAPTWREIIWFFEDKEKTVKSGVPQTAMSTHGSCESSLIRTKNSGYWIGLTERCTMLPDCQGGRNKEGGI